jgi:uroporphyrinogen-III synthase
VSLAGQRVLVMRPRDQAGDLIAALERAGALVTAIPILAIAPPPDPNPLAEAQATLSAYDWVALSSANAARALIGNRSLPPAHPRWAVVGAQTARVLREAGRAPDLIAEPSTGEGLASALIDHGVEGQRILIPQGDRASGQWVEALRRAGARVTLVPAYRVQGPDDEAKRALRGAIAQGLDWIIVTSPSSFQELLGAVGSVPSETRLAAIGPTSAAAIRAAGYEVAAEAATPGPTGLIAAIQG